MKWRSGIRSAMRTENGRFRLDWTIPGRQMTRFSTRTGTAGSTGPSTPTPGRHRVDHESRRPLGRADARHADGAILGRYKIRARCRRREDAILMVLGPYKTVINVAPLLDERAVLGFRCSICRERHFHASAQLVLQSLIPSSMRRVKAYSIVDRVFRVLLSQSHRALIVADHHSRVVDTHLTRKIVDPRRHGWCLDRARIDGRWFRSTARILPPLTRAGRVPGTPRPAGRSSRGAGQA